jgi:hypothetical protein
MVAVDVASAEVPGGAMTEYEIPSDLSGDEAGVVGVD